MKKRFRIFMLVMALGMFIFPTQSFFAQKVKTECCTTSSKESNSCHNDGTQKDHDCSKNQNSHDDGCNDNCCNHCNGCHAFFISIINEGSTAQSSSKILKENKSDFNYTSPHISGGLKEIWQPPKIA